MNAVFIIPTGLGCSIGGHAGDATPSAKMIASICDKLIVHPNVVNASDINEMTENMLYVEGSTINRFLKGQIELKETKGNKVLVVVNPPIQPETMNAINAARATIGLELEVCELNTPLVMRGEISNNIATGRHWGVDELVQQVLHKHFDALAIASPIDVSESAALDYFRQDGECVNPWGGIEAIVSKKIAEALGKPVAHVPIESDATKNDKDLFEILYNEVVDPRKAAEICSSCYIHCIFKGLHKAPRIGQGLSNQDIDALITPVGCIGVPHMACFEQGIPVIGVEENKTVTNKRSSRIHYVANYREAAGLLCEIKAGLNWKRNCLFEAN